MSNHTAHAAHIARKRFGQNFLQDTNIIASIVDAIAPTDDDCLVEIGPGLAALTEPLMRNIAHMHVVELDRDLVARLQNRFSPERLTIHSTDALKFDFLSIPAEGKTRKVVGNLPYNISSPLLFHLVEFAPHIDVQVFMLQKEVIERMVAAPATKAYGRLSVMLQYRFVMDWLLDVPPESFDPAPRVDSAVVRLIPRRPEDLTARDERHFAALVAQAFSQRRKMLRNTLKGVIDDAVFTETGIAPTVRAEDLSVADYIRLSNAVVSGNTTD